jgi:hypothetical protein
LFSSKSKKWCFKSNTKKQLLKRFDYLKRNCYVLWITFFRENEIVMVQRIPKICERECSHVCALLNCSLRRNRKCMCPLNAVFALNRFFFSRMVFALFCILGTSLKQSKSYSRSFSCIRVAKKVEDLYLVRKEGSYLSKSSVFQLRARNKHTPARAHTCR